jgi:hypothetical protein
MSSSKNKIALLGLLLCLAPAAGAGSPEPARPFPAVLAEAGLDYAGGRAFLVSKDYRRGDWKGRLPAFWTLAASDGAVRLRLEMTRNVGPAQAGKTMAQRFTRVDALYSGGAAYPGMVTTEFEVPPQLRPRDLRTGPGEKKVKVLAATAGLAYGAGSEDLVSYRGLMGYVYCEKSSLLAQIELFFPKENFDQAAALREFDELRCAAAPTDAVDVSTGTKK